MSMLRATRGPAPSRYQSGTADAAAATAPVTLQSAIYTGAVRHRRHAPKAHAFEYSLFLMYVDLAEIDRLFERRWFWSVTRRNFATFLRADYLGDPDVPLDQAVRDCVEQRTGVRPCGPVRLLTHLRYFGHCFNPVSFYYCFEPDGQTLHTIVAQVTNTPWKQRHAYVLPIAGARRHGSAHAWEFGKTFHVSPFMAMERGYAWRFSTPGEELRVHMDVLAPASTGTAPQPRELDVTMSLRRRPLDGTGLALVLVRYPLMTLRVVLAIHWQALRLWLKGNPVHDHPHNEGSPT